MKAICFPSGDHCGAVIGTCELQDTGGLPQLQVDGIKLGQRSDCRLPVRTLPQQPFPGCWETMPAHTRKGQAATQSALDRKWHPPLQEPASRTGRGSPPVGYRETSHTSGFFMACSSNRRATAFPSGDHAGSANDPERLVSRVACPRERPQHKVAAGPCFHRRKEMPRGDYPRPRNVAAGRKRLRLARRVLQIGDNNLRAGRPLKRSPSGEI